ncbi:aminoglycoside phosphotransferase family protein [Paenibacillus sp. IB182496]|uniref:Aminoglycoside phosphotransferase family protein n=1 Tax=Paenibacillus sabuli TaxID=2772509 RepID=A0A927BT98_9BACL|nr:aminoglycoside phosphotransferase family protein [Paenibacillus sabuli]MBD2845360.1 aminoglycoside phosphotransferase family protein [Paenibacillus sabuli]
MNPADHAIPSANELTAAIPELADCVAIEPIDKGYSGDIKLRATLVDGSSYLLRLFDRQTLPSRAAEFELLRTLEGKDVRCSRPVRLGAFEQGDNGYMLLRYIEGRDGEAQIGAYPPLTQYRIGCEAGEQLRLMHSIGAPADVPGWAQRKIAKHRSYAERYRRLGVRFAGGERVLDWIATNLDAMDGSANVFQHDDFHLNNLILRNGKLAGVIDFERYDWGDPAHDFLKLGFFCRQLSVPYAVGQIRGYFYGGEPDALFWRRYALYVAMCTISSAVWTAETVPGELDAMLERIGGVMDDHDGFERVRPRWYA